MKHLISATLSTEAIEGWQEWPKGSRSSRLSELIVSSGSFPAQLKALKIREGHLLGILAQVRVQMASQMRLNPHLNEYNRKKMKGIIMDIQEETLGTIYHDPSLGSLEFVEVSL